MTATTVDDWLLDTSLAPVVENDPLAPLYSAATRGDLALPFCAGCHQPLELDQEVCDDCGRTEQDWCAIDPRGTVHTATLMHRREAGLVLASDPYAIVDVELTSGHRLMMTTMQPTATAPAIGTRVRIGFRRLGDVLIPAINSMEDE